eukprot:scaffold176390_cov30-Tisochrysis_lutea.AAC.1
MTGSGFREGPLASPLPPPGRARQQRPLGGTHGERGEHGRGKGGQEPGSEPQPPLPPELPAWLAPR